MSCPVVKCCTCFGGADGATGSDAVGPRSVEEACISVWMVGWSVDQTRRQNASGPRASCAQPAEMASRRRRRGSGGAADQMSAADVLRQIADRK